MLDLFTDRARKVMALARQEAQKLNHDYIGPEHIFMAMAAEGREYDSLILGSMGGKENLDRVLDQLSKRVIAGPPGVVSLGSLPFTPRAKKSLEHAVEIAHDLGHNYLGIEHLLFGILRESDNMVVAAMTTADINPDSLWKNALTLIDDVDVEISRTNPLVSNDKAKTLEAMFARWSAEDPLYDEKVWPLIQKFLPVRLREHSADLQATVDQQARLIERLNSVIDGYREIAKAKGWKL